MHVKRTAYYFLFLICFGKTVQAQDLNPNASIFSHYSLVPSVYSLMRAEALTASAGQGSDPLFYNPAALPSAKISVGLAGVGTNIGADEQVIESLQSNEDENSIAQALNTLDTEFPAYVDLNTRLFDFTFPYISMVGFSRISAEAQNPSSRADENYFLLSQADIGAAFGLAVAYKGLSIGASQYLLRRTGISMLVNQTQMDTFRDATLTDSVDSTTLPYNDISTVSSGGAKGKNYGIRYEFFDDNPTALGISILNSGGTIFEDRLPLNNAKYEESEAKVLEGALEYGIKLDRPQNIDQVVNMGLVTGFGGGEDDIYRFELALDYNDINNSNFENKLAFSSEIGFDIPDKLALITSVPFQIDDVNYHIGLRKFALSGGIRPGAYQSFGGTIGFHLGMHRRISLIFLDFTGYQATILANENRGNVSMTGIFSKVGLTLIL